MAESLNDHYPHHVWDFSAWPQYNTSMAIILPDKYWLPLNVSLFFKPSQLTDHMHSAAAAASDKYSF